MFARPDGRDARIEDLVVVSLVDSDDHVLVLRLVEIVDQFLTVLTSGASHGVPPVDFDFLGHDIAPEKQHETGQKGRNTVFTAHRFYLQYKVSDWLNTNPRDSRVPGIFGQDTFSLNDRVDSF
jgi:hypothetical protein